MEQFKNGAFCNRNNLTVSVFRVCKKDIKEPVDYDENIEYNHYNRLVNTKLFNKQYRVKRKVNAVILLVDMLRELQSLLLKNNTTGIYFTLFCELC